MTGIFQELSQARPCPQGRLLQFFFTHWTFRSTNGSKMAYICNAN